MGQRCSADCVEPRGICGFLFGLYLRRKRQAETRCDDLHRVADPTRVRCFLHLTWSAAKEVTEANHWVFLPPRDSANVFP